MLHHLVHVELAAIDISWDLIVRAWPSSDRVVSDCPGFVYDWLEVAAEEAKQLYDSEAKIERIAQ